MAEPAAPPCPSTPYSALCSCRHFLPEVGPRYWLALVVPSTVVVRCPRALQSPPDRPAPGFLGSQTRLGRALHLCSSYSVLRHFEPATICQPTQPVGPQGQCALSALLPLNLNMWCYCRILAIRLTEVSESLFGYFAICSDRHPVLVGQSLRRSHSALMCQVIQSHCPIRHHRPGDILLRRRNSLPRSIPSAVAR